MPLIKSSSKDAVSQNIRTEKSAGKPQRQAVAIALDVARRSKRKTGGGIPRMADGGVPWFARSEARAMMHTGPIGGIGPGRVDIHSMNVPAGAHVLPADSISHLGQNNTAAGLAKAAHMFGASGPYGSGSSGPYGVKIPHGGGGTGAPKPPKLGKFAKGGEAGDTTGQPVPIKSASGEFVIPPEIVKSIGGGSLDAGHAAIDKWILKLRARHIATLKKLPKPAKD